MELRERIAIADFAALDDIPIQEAKRILGLGISAPHDGDCTKQPYSCIACIRETALVDGDRLVSRLAEMGLEIVEKK